MAHVSVFALFLLTSCALFQKRPVENLSYITGDGLEASVTSEEIAANLTKNSSNAGGYYQINVLPLSAPYLRAKRQEQSLMRGLTPRELAELEMKDEQRYVLQRFCVRVQATVTRHQAATDLSQWEVLHENSEGVQTQMSWLLPLDPVIRSVAQGAHGPEDQWQFAGEACSDRELPVTPQFHVVLKPPFTPWPFPGYNRLTWSFYEDRQEAKEKSPTFKRYRGY